MSQIARNNGGELRSFNGDGVLIAFIGDSRCTNAAKAGLRMSWFCRQVLKPKLQAYFQDNEQLKNIDFDYGLALTQEKFLLLEEEFGAITITRSHA